MKASFAIETAASDAFFPAANASFEEPEPPALRTPGEMEEQQVRIWLAAHPAVSRGTVRRQRVQERQAQGRTSPRQARRGHPWHSRRTGLDRGDRQPRNWKPEMLVLSCS